MKNGFHGRGFGTLSLTNTNKLHKVGLPAFEWPKLQFPDIKYPLDQHAEHNKQEEAKSLEHAKELFKDESIAGIILEPIMAEGGDKRASNE